MDDPISSILMINLQEPRRVLTPAKELVWSETEEDNLTVDSTAMVALDVGHMPLVGASHVGVEPRIDTPLAKNADGYKSKASTQYFEFNGTDTCVLFHANLLIIIPISNEINLLEYN